MLPRALAGLGLLLAVWCMGCERDSDRALSDTEGRKIRARCTQEGECKLSLTSGNPLDAEHQKLALYRRGNLVGVCDTKDGTPTSPRECRALVCAGDSDCPPNHGLKNGTCINGLCREPATSIIVDDAIMLCLAGTGLGNSRPDLVALALNCGHPCRVPEVCRQP